MKFVIGKDNPDLKICLADDEWPGAKRTAHKVAEDISLVTGIKPEVSVVADADATVKSDRKSVV